MRVLSSDVRLAKSPAFCGSLMHFDLKKRLSCLRKMALHLSHKPTLTVYLVTSTVHPRAIKEVKIAKMGDKSMPHVY